MTMTTVIQHCCAESHDLVYNLILPALQALEETVKSPQTTGEKLKTQQDLLCGLIQVQLVKIGERVTPDMGKNII